MKLDGMNSCKTPCAIEVRRATSHVVEFEKSDTERVEGVLKQNLAGIFWANILLGGIPGMLVDYSADTMWDLGPDKIGHAFDGTKSEKWIEPVAGKLTYSDLLKLTPDAQHAFIPYLKNYPNIVAYAQKRASDKNLWDNWDDSVAERNLLKNMFTEGLITLPSSR